MKDDDGWSPGENWVPREMRLPRDLTERLEQNIRRERRMFWFEGTVALAYSCWTVYSWWDYFQEPDWTIITTAMNTGFAVFFWYQAYKTAHRWKKWDDLKRFGRPMP